MGLPDCPTYARLHVLHFSWHMPLWLGLLALLESCWYIVFVGRKVIFRLVLLNRLVTLCIEGLWYVKVTHFLLCCCITCVCVVPSWSSLQNFMF